MPNLDIGNAVSSDMTNKVTEWEVGAKHTDGATGNKETEWMNSRWSIQNGYFLTISELQSALIMKTIWNVGKGYETDVGTKVILESIKGYGKDTFLDILFNLYLVSLIGGDSYAEIIRDSEGNLINLKPLDPGSIKIIVNEQGIIDRYEQVNKLKPGSKVIKFDPSEILHISNDRYADNIHGTSKVDALEPIIKADQENFEDVRKLMHRQRGMMLFKLGTDNATKIAEFVNKMDVATNKGENIYVPDDENTFSFEPIPINVSAVIMQWRDDLRNKFYRALGLPLILFGSSGSTESGGKIEYLAHEQVFERDQRKLEEQLWAQLQIRIDLRPPVTLLENLQADENKDAQNALMFQQNDVTAGSGR